jgi:hypothetical protein
MPNELDMSAGENGLCFNVRRHSAQNAAVQAPGEKRWSAILSDLQTPHWL